MQHPSERKWQCRVSTLLSWTGVVCVLLGAVFAPLPHEDLGIGEWIGALIVLGLLFVPPFTCIPGLIDHLLLKKNGLVFSLFGRIWLTLNVGVYSMFALMLATIGFMPDWKGAKGHHWFYYTLDGWAGITWWPIFGYGVIVLIAALFSPAHSRYTVEFLIGALVCCAISFWYVFATLFLDFADEPSLALIPGACGVCYALFAAIIIRNREFGRAKLRSEWKLILAWFSALAISTVVKFPLAMTLYANLPDEPPDGCFIVTAASRGHRGFVGTWFDEGENRILNRQLLTFWAFERCLKTGLPRSHRFLRRIYNRVGPFLARLIVFRWQADLVYLMMKPVEWLARWVVRSKGQ